MGVKRSVRTTPRPIHRNSTLADQLVRPITLWRYRSALRLFFQYWDIVGSFTIVSFSGLDDAVSMFIEHLFSEGEPKSLANYVVASLQHHLPQARGHFHGSWRLIRAWHKLAPPQRSTPLPASLVRTIAMICFCIDMPRMGLAVLLGFHCCLRTGEILALRAGDIEIASDRGCIALHATKTSVRRQASEIVTIEDPSLVKLLRSVLAQLSSTDVFVGLTNKSFRQAWTHLLVFLKLDPAVFTPYSLRRGGATFYFRQTGSLDRAILRGRWQSSKTARLYIEDAQAQLVSLRLDSYTQHLVDVCENLWKSFPGR